VSKVAGYPQSAVHPQCGRLTWIHAVGRSRKDLERLIDVADGRGVQLRTVNGGDLDLSTSSGRMLARILGSVARQESEHKGERRRRANQQRRAAGKWRADGARVYGYTKTGEPFEPEASLLRQAAADVLAGVSLRSIAIDWNKRGMTTTRGKGWTNLALRRVLTNPLYASLVTYEGRVVGDGEWEPVIAKEVHHGLVAYLSDPARKPGSAWLRKHMLSGVARCGICGEPLYAIYPYRGKGKPSPPTYSCRAGAGGHVARLGALLDEYVEGFVLGLFSRPKDRKHLSALLNGGRDVDVKALQTQRDALQARMDELARMFTAGDIDGSQLRSGTAEYKTQLAGINQVLGGMSQRSPAAGLLAADDPRAYWDTCSPDIRGKIVDDVMTVTVLPAPHGRWFRDRDNPTTGGVGTVRQVPGHQAQSRAMSYTTIEIYCADSSHEGQRYSWFLARADKAWHPEHTPDRRLKHTGSVVQWLATPGTKGPARPRYKFKCGLCGRCVTGRGEKMIPILDTVSTLDPPEISIRALAAILRLFCGRPWR
jgi:site-specific DNA recombinase